MIYPRHSTYREIDWPTGNADIEPVLARLNLTTKQAEVIILRMDGFTQPEIAELLGISLRAVQERMIYAKGKLEALRH